MEDRDECIIIGQIYGITGEKRDDRQAELCLSDVLWNMTDEQKKEYNALLDVNGSGIMGYLDIPKISVTLPIYHGTDEAVLQIAIGHLAGTSLPVGGEGCRQLVRRRLLLRQSLCYNTGKAFHPHGWRKERLIPCFISSESCFLAARPRRRRGRSPAPAKAAAGPSRCRKTSSTGRTAARPAG